MGKNKIVTITEGKLVDLINDIVENTIKERNLVPATVKENVKTKKVVVTEAQLKALQDKGCEIKSITKIEK